MIKIVDVAFVIILPDDTFISDMDFSVNGELSLNREIKTEVSPKDAMTFSKEEAEIASSKLTRAAIIHKVKPLVYTVLPGMEFLENF